jgi:dienelactone hydrolase
VALERALPGEWGEMRAAASATKIGDAAADAMKVIGVHATSGARWAPDVGRAPVLVFTPGNGWLPTDYSVLLEDLASHGYVVIGVAPVGLADVVRLPDGRSIRKTLGVGAAIGNDQVHAHRDVLHLLSRLVALDSDPRAPWHHHLDLARVGAFGHSLGGTTALVAAATDSLIRAAVNLDGDAMGSVTDVRPRQPLLFVSSEVPSMTEAPPAPNSAWTELTRRGLERSERRRTEEWSRISSRAASATRVRLMGARHLDFTDAALVSGLIVGPERRWMRWGQIDGARGLRITADLVRAVFDHALLGRPRGALLVDPRREYPELRLVVDEGAPGA